VQVVSTQPGGEPGPCSVANPADPDCDTPGDYTAVRYKLTGQGADHVSTLVTANNSVYTASGNSAYAACSGDGVTGLGKYSCHEKAVRFNPALYKQGNSLVTGDRFLWVVVAGNKQPIQTSIAVKKGSCVQSYSVIGLGLDFNAVAPVTETLTHENPTTQEKCSVEFTLDSIGGNVLSAKLTPDSIQAGCNLRVDNAPDVEIKINGILHRMKFGQGYFQSGEQSCTTRVIGGRVYSWGNPCPE
jgi:hypothetical protein